MDTSAFRPPESPRVTTNKAIEEFNEAKAAGVVTRPVVLGPVSFLVLSKAAKEAKPSFHPISLLTKLILVYKQPLGNLKAAGATGAEWVQVDEPILVLNAAETSEEFSAAYSELVPVSPKIMLTTYYDRHRLEPQVRHQALRRWSPHRP